MITNGYIKKWSLMSKSSHLIFGYIFINAKKKKSNHGHAKNYIYSMEGAALLGHKIWTLNTTSIHTDGNF